MTFWVYILHCADGSYYTGHTDGLDHRLSQHQAGAIPGYTETRRPVVLTWSQEFATRIEALTAERQIKGWTRRKKEALIRGDRADLHDAAIPPSARALRLRSGQTGVDGVVPSPSASASASPSFRTGEGRSTALPPQPAIVLVRPQLGENIGKAARAMLNFGLTDLRLVTPRDGWPNPAAGPAASGADVVLADARVFDSVAAATADCAHVYATTVRRRGVTKPVVTPAEAAAAVHAEPGRSGFVFGPERAGLETDDVAVARSILTVPINPAFGSLNLAQAVILVAYEWSKGVGDLVQPPETHRDPPAPQGELDGMIEQFDGMLEATGYYHPPDRKPTTKRAMRTVLTKPGWSSQELRTVRGMLSALAGKKPRRD